MLPLYTILRTLPWMIAKALFQVLLKHARFGRLLIVLLPIMSVETL